MHLRNPYRTPPDFVQLAEDYPLLKPFVFLNKQGIPSINFKDAAAQRYLTEALLRRDFKLRVEIPHDRLCPAVPNRLNYVLWIQDIMTASPPDNNKGVCGIDIGTGASVIYPLLACSSSPSWTFIATDIDQQSLIAAEKNIVLNSLQNRIILVQSDPSGTILQHLFDDQRIQQCDFVMCNPPFYASKDEVNRAAEDKEFDPNAVCTGADVEMITPGGETEFVRRIVQESMAIGTRCRWYTSLLGRHSSITSVVELFRSLKIDNYGITEFIQGHTRRWGVAWSFGQDRLPDTLVRETSESLHALLPLPNNLRQTCSSIKPASISSLINLIEEFCQELDGIVFSSIPVANAEQAVIKIWAKENTWSRKARRRLERLRKDNAMMAADAIGSVQAAPESEATVVLLVRCFDEQDGRAESKIWNLEASWMRGKDRELFETLWSHLSRKILDRLAV